MCPNFCGPCREGCSREKGETHTVGTAAAGVRDQPTQQRRCSRHQGSPTIRSHSIASAGTRVDSEPPEEPNRMVTVVNTGLQAGLHRWRGAIRLESSGAPISPGGLCAGKALPRSAPGHGIPFLAGAQGCGRPRRRTNPWSAGYRNGTAEWRASDRKSWR